ISNHVSLFKCPICDSSMEIQQLKSMICANRHTFDFAKQVYLNLMTNPVKTNYDRALFEARRKVIVESDFFSSLHSNITNMINQYTAKSNLSIVDMGAGEGSHLDRISDQLQSNYDKTVVGVGLDISKEGILEAAKNYENKIWLVADLAKTPLNDRTVDVMLNILSPSNYEEFNRLLKDDGIMIKIVPREGYLKELRQYFHGESNHKDYSNENVITLFKEEFNLVDQVTIHYTSVLDPSSLQALVKMTPLTWGVEESHLNRFLESGVQHITVDLDLMIGRKKGE